MELVNQVLICLTHVPTQDHSLLQAYDVVNFNVDVDRRKGVRVSKMSINC